MIINFCSGGIGNRLKPLSSCYAISKLTGRELGIIWEPTMRCGGRYSYLFENNIKQYSLDYFLSQKSLSIYSEFSYVMHEVTLNGNRNSKLKQYLNRFGFYLPTFLKLVKKYGVFSLSETDKIMSDTSDCILVYSNDFIKNCPENLSRDFFKNLLPISSIRKRIIEAQMTLNLNKTVIGVHARGTDFECGGVTVDTYIDQMKQEYMKDENVRFFVCSDSHEYEKIISDIFPGNVCVNNKSSYVSKAFDKIDSWSNNVQTPEESVQESLVDMYLLSKTNFKIYHPNSTFAHVAKLLTEL